MKKRSFHQSDLIRLIQQKTQYNQDVIRDVMNAFVDAVPTILVEQGSLVIMNFGTFNLRVRKNSINPKTKERLKKPCLSPTFKQSKNLKHKLDEKTGQAKNNLLNQA